MKTDMVSLVSTELKTNYCLDSAGTNFLVWKEKLDFVLRAAGIGYVLTVPKSPVSTDDEDNNDDNSRETQWDMDDSYCRYFILNSIDKDMSIMYMDQPTAKSLMDALTAHFRPTLSRRISLYKQYFNRQMAVDCPIGRHIAQMGVAAAELEAVRVEVPETMKVVALIESLPPSWKDKVLFDDVLARTDLEEDLTTKVVNERLRSMGDARALYEKKDAHIGVKIVKGVVMIVGSFVFAEGIFVDRE